MSRLIHGELSESIIGAAMAVHTELRPGLDEKPYENAPVSSVVPKGPSRIARGNAPGTKRSYTF